MDVPNGCFNMGLRLSRRNSLSDSGLSRLHHAMRGLECWFWVEIDYVSCR